MKGQNLPTLSEFPIPLRFTPWISQASSNYNRATNEVLYYLDWVSYVGFTQPEFDTREKSIYIVNELFARELRWTNNVMTTETIDH